MTARDPLTVEQVATALKLPLAALARARQRDALGLEKTERPDWCLDRRVTFFSADSVEAAVARQRAARDRLRAARAGVLPPSWADFEHVAVAAEGPQK